MTLDRTTRTARTAINTGDSIPTLELEMTATKIVAGALATRDFMPVHHDRAYAESQGAPDIFMNIISSTGYCSRYLTDWAGPDSMIRRLSIRLGVPVFPGSALVFTGTVTGVSSSNDEDLVDVELRAATPLGDHLTGTAMISLPRS